MAEHGYTLILNEPGLPPTEFHLAPGPEEIRSEKNALTTLIPLPKLSVYRESHGNGIEEITLSGTFGYKKRQVGPAVWTGAEMFLIFRKDFWDKYQSLIGSDDPIQKKTTIEYHNWDEDEHYYAEPTRFVTPRGTDNRTFFRYEFSLQLYASIAKKFIQTVEDKLSKLDRTLKWIKMILEKMADWGQSLGKLAGEVSSAINRNVLQPLALLSTAIESVINGVSALITYPANAVLRIADNIASLFEKMGSIAGDELTTIANLLRNTKRVLLHLYKSPDVFKQSIGDGADELSRQYYEEIDWDNDSETVQEEKRSGRNLSSKQYATVVNENSYQGAQRVRVRVGDTLQKIAVRYLGSASKWHDIALMNDLSDTDLSSLAGQDIFVPTIPALEGTGVVGDLGDDRLSQKSMSERLYGRDLALEDKDGKLSVVFGANNDLVTVAGEDNLKQAITLKTRIFQGQLLEEPEFGLARVIGRKGTPTGTLALKHGLEVTAKSDPRIKEATVSITRESNISEATFALVPVGVAGSRPVTTVVGVV